MKSALRGAGDFMKNLLKPVFLMATLMTLSACGSSQAPIMSMGYGNNNGYTTTPWGNNTTWNNSGTGSYTQQIAGGTLTVIPVVGGYATANSSKVLSVAAQVQAGDVIKVNGSSSYAYGITSGFPVQNSFWLTNLTVKVDGAVVGTGLYGNFTSNQSGTLSVSFDAQTTIGNGWNYSSFQVYFGYGGGLSVVRCRDTNNQPMTCPL